jgi:hypothetical protein
MTRLFVLTAAWLALAGCGGTAADPGVTTSVGAQGPPAEERLSESPEGDFTLYVSNQSFDIPEVDIRISIDGLVAVEDTFAVEDQHNWVEFVFDLPEGAHIIEAVSHQGDAELVRRFTVKAEHWAVVDYWYYPDEKKHFSFSISNEPIGFA